MPTGGTRLFFVGSFLALIAWGGYEFVTSLTSLGDWASPPPAPRAGRLPQALRREAAIGAVPQMPRAGLPSARSTHPQAAPVPFRGSDAVEIPPALPLPEVSSSSAGAYRVAAEAYLASMRAAWNIQEYHELRPEVFETPKGAEVRYSVYQNGMPIVGMEIRLELGTDRQVTGVQNSYTSVRRADLSQPSMDYQTILDRYQGRDAMDDGSTSGVAKVLYLGEGTDTPEVSYVIPVKEGGQGQELIFRASDGQLIGRRPPSGEL